MSYINIYHYLNRVYQMDGITEYSYYEILGLVDAARGSIATDSEVDSVLSHIHDEYRYDSMSVFDIRDVMVVCQLRNLFTECQNVGNEAESWLRMMTETD